mmetsp:Transcript_7908/g.12654  ORF Transcript_7908/g.12654 Transcript_7908/m.12654 type:complete len:543 (+) Transcript_7908:97-1725(+)
MISDDSARLSFIANACLAHWSRPRSSFLEISVNGANLHRPKRQFLTGSVTFGGSRIVFDARQITEIVPRRAHSGIAQVSCSSSLVDQKTAVDSEEDTDEPPLFNGGSWQEDDSLEHDIDLANESGGSLDVLPPMKPKKPKLEGTAGGVSGTRVHRAHKGLPIVAVIGRPNVGKSMIVNRLSKTNDSIVHDSPGITRDRTYRPAFWGKHDFLVVDTGGLVFDDDTDFLPLIREQAMIALSEACAALFIVDGQAGPTPHDEEIAAFLRKQNKPVFLLVNKCESETTGYIMAANFWGLGLGEPYAVSGIHGNGLAEMLEQLITLFPRKKDGEDEDEADEIIKVAIVGKPNVGKSTLLNRFVGQTRSIVSPISGTTRDTIDMLIEKDGTMYQLIDTAGVRKRTKVSFGPEYFGINRAFKAIRRSDIVLFMIDAQFGVTEQDQKLAERIEQEGRGCIILVNKWDEIPDKDSNTIYGMESDLRSRLTILEWAPMVFISALTGQRVSTILDAVNKAFEEHSRRVSTNVRLRFHKCLVYGHSASMFALGW